MHWLAVVVVIGCGSPAEQSPADAAPPVDTPPDPFVGMYDDPSDLPRDHCTPGALAAFSHSEIWFELELRTDAGPPLRTFMTTYLAEEEVPHSLTADDLFLRRSSFDGFRWTLRVVNVCGVDANGTLRGARASCYETSSGPQCFDGLFEEPPFRRIEGEGDGEHLTLLGEFGADWPSASSNVRVAGDVAYLSRFDDGLRIVSITNPAAPVELGHFVIPGEEFANDLKLVTAGGRRYAITASRTANVIDVTDPAAPQLVAQLPFSPHSVFVDGTMLYLVDGGGAQVQVWDVSNPRAPVERGNWEHPDSQRTSLAWHDIFVEGGVAYLSDINGTGMHVVDFRDPASPVVLGGESELFGTMWHSPWLTRVGGRPIAINGTESSTPGMRLLDGDPQSPTFLDALGEWSLVRGSAHNLMAIGSLVYLAHFRDGVRVVDIANLAAPAQIGYFNTWPLGNGNAGAGDLGAYGIDLDPARKRIYVADSVRGLVILQGDSTVFP